MNRPATEEQYAIFLLWLAARVPFSPDVSQLLMLLTSLSPKTQAGSQLLPSADIARGS
jgi:hypothetical protein